jgi:hypothetical protein
MDSSSGTDNLIAALEQSNRVCKVSLSAFVDWQLEKVLDLMQVPFPELTDLNLYTSRTTVPVIPDSFLDGFAPRLRNVTLSGIPFPGLPNLLFSATHLVQLLLFNIPHTGYFSPEAIVALLSVSSSLETLTLQFPSPQSYPHWETRRPPPSRRSVIPALISFNFKGVTEYLEDLVIFIDAPQLDDMRIHFFNQIDFDTPRLAQFINRTPKLWKPNAIVRFDDYSARVEFRPGLGYLEIRISCRELDWQFSSIEQVCNSSLYPLSTAEALCIDHRYWRPIWRNDVIENTVWLRLLSPFTAAKDLYLFKEFAPGIAAALQELIGGRITEVLPSLQKIYVEGLEPSGPFQENIGRFIAARQLSDHTITVSGWDTGR